MVQRRYIDVHTLTQDELGEVLEGLWSQEERLRPDPYLHDYQLTYPPAIQIERPEHKRQPSMDEFNAKGLGQYRSAAYYFHFGFCQYRCRYCFHYELKTGGQEALMERYVSALIEEMKRVRPLTQSLKTGLYFLGGGTPTALPLHLIERFLDALVEIYGRPPTSMSTVEAKPVTATDEKLAAYVKAGFRRINFGVQTLDPELYAFHHQNESLDVALDAVERAKKQGFEWVNIDIMTGLEKQSPESWQLTLKTLESLARQGKIDSFFIYPFHEDPRSRTFGQPSLVPPLLETIHSDAQARGLFQKLGWSELGARFYRSPKHVRREIFELLKIRINPAYGEVLYHGFGNSSFSVGDQATYLNHRDVRDYCDVIESGKLGMSHWYPLNNAQRATRDMTFDLLYSPFTRVRSRRKKYGKAVLEKHEALLQRWVELGLGQFHRLFGTFSLTNLGKLVHQQMIPQHYLAQDRKIFDSILEERRLAGAKYRGY